MQGVTPIQVQLQQFKTLVEKNQIDRNLLKDSFFFIESGSNDIFNYFNPFFPPSLPPPAYVQSMTSQVADFLSAAYDLGARRIAVFGLGPVGCVPARSLLPGAPTAKCFGRMNRMVKDYNTALRNLVRSLPENHPGAVAVFGSVYETIQIFRSNPSRYGE